VKIFASILLLSAGLFCSVSAQEVFLSIDSLRVTAGYLRVDFHADSLLTAPLLANMRRGVTSAAQFRVQLWRKRSWLFSGVVSERTLEIKSTYDVWEQQYLLQTPDERRLTKSLQYVKQRWEQHRNLVLVDSTQWLAKHRYYIVVEVRLEPVSRESLQEIRGWLSGEMKALARRDSASAAPAQSGRGIQDRVLDTVLDLTGLGEQVTSIQSPFFRIRDDGTISFEK